jgi:hypothetical protein
MTNAIDSKVIKNKVYDRLNTSYQLVQVYFREILDREKLKEAILVEMVMATDEVMKLVTMQGK